LQRRGFWRFNVLHVDLTRPRDCRLRRRPPRSDRRGARA
jgi:hypothetical protein